MGLELDVRFAAFATIRPTIAAATMRMATVTMIERFMMLPFRAKCRNLSTTITQLFDLDFEANHKQDTFCSIECQQG